MTSLGLLSAIAAAGCVAVESVEITAVLDRVKGKRKGQALPAATIGCRAGVVDEAKSVASIEARAPPTALRT